MSTLERVFVRVHFRYDRDRYAKDLEQFATWLLTNGYPNKTIRTHVFRVQQVLHAGFRKSGHPLFLIPLHSGSSDVASSECFA